MTASSSPTLFISYRRDDASARAGRLCDWLKRQFGATRVFLDTDKIAAGDDFARVLDERLASTDVLIVVIGPGWLDAANDRGRRLDQADDFVRQEVASGLAAGKRVVPVLVGGAQMPAEAELPEALKALHLRNAAIVDDASFERDFNALVDDILQRPRGYLRREVDRLTRLVRALRLTSLLVPVLAVVVVLALWVSLLAPLNLDTLAENSLLWLADEIAPLPEDAGVTIVAIDDASVARLGPPFGANARWRGLHARLIERARAAGASAVAFDLAFTGATGADARLAGAARSARSATPPMRVILGGHRFDDAANARPAPLAALTHATTCLIQRDQRYLVPLATLPADTPMARHMPVHDAAFALAAAFAGTVSEADIDERRLRLDGVPDAQAPRFSSLERVPDDTCVPPRRGDTVAALLLRASAADYWQAPARHIAYADVLDPAVTPDARLAGRILVVGDARRDSRDRHPLSRGFTRRSVPGVELHAEAIATLVHHRETVQPTVDQALAILAGMGLAGAATGFFAAPLPPWPRRAVTALVVLAYLGLATALAVGGFLLNLPYDLTALFLAWAVLHRLQAPDRSWSPAA
ncbi:CHASE2 domain-containing protein [Nitrogeniibacter mangrovi]|uniref:CHASE2 domain-containing protein n=1 Tax=Nitrogeniibacter mangrovi TaxID=2016596 RepID=A0A6C1BA10_9RHOO|nr:CHASE2 domain-containing protein [Nitrogeniibacter mangrovi]QID19210.1 CHASE2 domain-containing protein [Nitrogeniibacter mangrovi]